MIDRHTESGTPDSMAHEMMLARIQEFIFPNVANTTEQQAAIEKAVTYQWQHEETVFNALDGKVIPENVSGFKAGEFSMSFTDKGNGRLTRDTMCPAAYACLFNAGLCYKGVGAYRDNYREYQ